MSSIHAYIRTTPLRISTNPDRFEGAVAMLHVTNGGHAPRASVNGREINIKIGGDAEAAETLRKLAATALAAAEAIEAVTA